MTTRHDKERQRAAQEKYQAVLSQLLKDEDNKYCVDCDAKGPRWASWNLGIFLCIRCAGIHRNLGVHISKVKSVNLDTWTAEQLAMLMEMGNSRARAVYEANLPDNFRRPQTDSGSALEAFIRAKYEHKRYIAREWVQPKPSVPRQLLEDEHKDKKKTRPRPSSMIQLNAPSQKQEAKEPETSQPLKEVAKETKKTSHADDLLNLSSPGDSGGGTTNTSLLDDFLGASGTPTANATPPPAQNQSNGQTSTTTSTSNQQTFQQNGAFDDSLFTSAGTETKTSDKTTKESIMALYGSSNQQQGMYGVPGGQTSSMMNSLAGTVPQSIYMNQQGLLYMAPQQMQADASSMYKFVYTDNNTAGGMYMPAQALNMQAVPPTNPMAVQQGMPGMVPQGMMVMQQGGMYQMAGGGMMPAGAVGNPMAAGAPAGMMMQQPQVGMFATASPPQPQMNMQQMQQQMAAMRMNAPGTMAPGGQMGIRPQAGAQAATPTNPWGMPATSGQTLSTNLWQ